MERQTKGSFAMTAALNYLSRLTDEIFASQMQRASVRISACEQIFHRRAS